MVTTTSPSEFLAPYYERAPVILAPNEHAAWLGEDRVRDVGELPQPYPLSRCGPTGSAPRSTM